MRIISGKYKGRSVEGYDIDGTRPTMDRVKESLFAILQNKIIDSVCLDLFAGSGNLGLEALSNGAKECYFVDNNKIAIEKIKKNIASIKVEEKNNIIYNDFKKAIEQFNKDNIKFDLIFLDPPYKDNLINLAINSINENNILNKDGYIACEFENESIDVMDYSVIKEKKYGSKKIIILKKMQ